MEMGKYSYRTKLKEILENSQMNQKTKILHLQAFKEFLAIKLQQQNKGKQYPSVKYIELRREFDLQYQKVKCEVDPVCRKVLQDHLKLSVRFQDSEYALLACLSEGNDALKESLQRLKKIKSQMQKSYRSIEDYLKCKKVQLYVELEKRKEEQNKYKSSKKQNYAKKFSTPS